MVHNKMLVGKRVTRMCKVWRDMFDLYKLETEQFYLLREPLAEFQVIH